MSGPADGPGRGPAGESVWRRDDGDPEWGARNLRGAERQGRLPAGRWRLRAQAVGDPCPEATVRAVAGRCGVDFSSPLRRLWIGLDRGVPRREPRAYYNYPGAASTSKNWWILSQWFAKIQPVG